MDRRHLQLASNELGMGRFGRQSAISELWQSGRGQFDELLVPMPGPGSDAAVQVEREELRRAQVFHMRGARRQDRQK